MKKTLSILSIALLVLMAGCAGLGPTDEENDTGTDEITTTDNGDGTFSTGVLTTDGSSTDFVYFDFTSGEGVLPGNPGDSDTWCLGFLNYEIIVNGGVSGTGSLAILGLPGENFETMSDACMGDYICDQDDPDPGNPYDGDGYAFNQAGDGTPTIPRPTSSP
ncbi:MAG: HmuY family protein [Candidatus Krumholzibacteria bacterium]|nr:HmuY family protein [Candidatus Krumholzibacteria bacterium]